MVKVRVYPSVLSGRIRAPPSKSYTHRVVVMASLAYGISKIENPLVARDTVATFNACKAIGATVHDKSGMLEISGTSTLSVPDDIMDAKNSGTTLRIMTAVSSLIPSGFAVLTGDSSIRRRPMQPLLDALTALGSECWSARGDGRAPIIVRGGGLEGGRVAIKGDVSSQFISALLIASAMAKNETSIEVMDNLVSRPYVDVTLETMKKFGVKVQRDGYGFYKVPEGQEYVPTSFSVPGDLSSSAIMLAGATLTGGHVSIEGLDPDFPQADWAFTDFVKRMGAKVNVDRNAKTVTVSSSNKLNGGTFDLSDSPDLLPVMAVLATKAKGDVSLVGIGHARLKETDRISILAHELSKMGVSVKEGKDSLTIRSHREVKKCVLDSHGDHRLFMTFCAIGLGTPEGLAVEGLETSDISYPNFIADIQRLGGKIEVLND